MTSPRLVLARPDLIVSALLVAAWALIAVLINPVGDFPLNDDWAYGLPARWLVEDGRLRFTDWQSHPLITQVLWGSAFALPSGFSWTALRISTLTLAAVCLVATYVSGREAGLDRPTATAVAALLLVNPMFVSLANTFMTDVPCLSLMMVALALFLHGLRTDRGWSFWAGWMVVLLASLMRQVALAIPLGLVVALAIKDGLGVRWLVRGVLPAFVVGFVVIVAYPKVIEATVGLPSVYHLRSGLMGRVFGDLAHLRFGALKPLLLSVGYGTMHLGLWMLPLLYLLRRRLTGATTRSGQVTMMLVVVGIALALTRTLDRVGLLMPLGDAGNIVTDAGTGILTLHGQLPRTPRAFWVGITFLAAIGTTLIVLALIQVARRDVARVRERTDVRSLWLTVFLLVSALIYYIPISMNYGAWFDRYTLPLIPFLAIVIARLPSLPRVANEGTEPALPGLRVPLACGFLLAFLAFSIASTHDYLAWNRARWTAGLDLIARQKIDLADIDGGFEFNNDRAWKDGRPGADRLGTSPVVVVAKDPRFVLSFSDLPGYHRLRQYAVERWLPLTPDSVLVLERVGEE